MNIFKNLKNASFDGGQSIFAADTGGGYGRRVRRLGVGPSTPAKAKTAKYAIANPAALHREFQGAGSPFLKYKAFFMARSVECDALALSRPNDKLVKKVKKKAKLAIIPTLHPASPWLVDIVGQCVVYARRRALAHAIARAVLTPPRSAGLLTEKAAVVIVPEEEKSYNVLTPPKMSLTPVNARVLGVQVAIAKQLVLELPATFAKANGLHLAAHNHLQVVVYTRPPSVMVPSAPVQMLIAPREYKLKVCFVQVGFAKMLDLELSAKFCKANGLRLAAVNHFQVVTYRPLRLPIPSDVGSAPVSRTIIISLPRTSPAFHSSPFKDTGTTSFESNDAFLAINGPTSLELFQDSTEVGHYLPITVKLPPAKDHIKNCPILSTSFGIPASMNDPEAHHSPATEAAPAPLFIVSAESLKSQLEQCLVQQDYASGPNLFEVTPKKYDDKDDSIDGGKNDEDLCEDKTMSVNEDKIGDQDPLKGSLGDSSNRANDIEREFGVGPVELTKEVAGQNQEKDTTSEPSTLLNEDCLQGGSSSPATGASIQVPLSEIGRDHDLSPSHRRSQNLQVSMWSCAATPLEAVFEPTPTASSQRSLTSLIWACEDLLGSARTTISGRQYESEDDGKAGDKVVIEHYQDDGRLVEQKLAMGATPIQGYIDETAHPSPPAARTIPSDANKDAESLVDSATSSDGSSQESDLPSKRSFASSIWSRRSFSFNSRQALSSMINRVPRSDSSPQGGQGGKEAWKAWKAGKIRGRKGGVRDSEGNKENELEGSGRRKWRKVVNTLKRAAGSAK